MGHCSSSPKYFGGKPRGQEDKFDVPMDCDGENGGIVAPRPATELGSNRAARRALDERTVPMMASESNKAFRHVEEFGLAGLRPSVDDATCTALLALRMGRGSSVGGFVERSPDPRTGGSSLEMKTMTSLPEEDLMDHSAHVPGNGAGNTSSRRPRSYKTQMSCDSNDRLEKLLGDSDFAMAPSVPAAK